jgi:hypothetical protein
MATTALAVSEQETKNNPLFDETDLIPIFLRDVAQAGLVGEENNATTVLLSAASAALPEPINLSLGGESSSGKNFILQKGTAPIPDENKMFLSGMTPKVLMHAAEDEFKHKARRDCGPQHGHVIMGALTYAAPFFVCILLSGVICSNRRLLSSSSNFMRSLASSPICCASF